MCVMTKKIWIIFALVMLLPAVTLMTSCAKKKIYSDSSQSAEDAARAAERARQEALAKQRGFDEQQLKDQAGGRGGGAGGTGGAGGSGMDSGRAGSRSSFVSEDIYFEYDSASLVPEAREVLKRKAEWMRGNPNVSVIVEGHTDERGTVAYNTALGEKRASTAMSFLSELGIPASRMTTVSYGKEKPANSGHNESAWAANRRVHFEMKK
jgi:peptidoglycan-associated lipoprotein